MSQDLFKAALDGDQDTLQSYKKQNPKVSWDKIKDASGNTLIAAAASKGKLHVIDYLVADGATVNLANNQNQCALQIAYNGGHPNTARGLIKHYRNADISLPLSTEELEKLQA